MAIVTLYEHHDFNMGPPPRDNGGLVIPLDTSWQALTRVRDINGNWVNFNDKMTSYRVAPGYTVVFFMHENYRNEMFRVPPKPLETRYIGPDAWGYCQCNGDGLGYRFDDEISSIKIFDAHGQEIPQP